jgi:hypothetical protein
MKIRINSLRLTGTDRSVTFRPGLNIITGPITTGKTTLVRLCRILLGSRIASLPREVLENSSSVAGEILLGDDDYSIVRPLSSSPGAPVEIAGDAVALRLPAHRADSSQLSFGQWLLERLNLPRLDVPSAPTRPESEPTPVSINDYLLYCDLTQSEIDDMVFGHHDPYKNIKRKYVFEILYGAYGVETALLHEELREVESRLRALGSDRAVLERLLADTPWSNRAELERQLSEAQQNLGAVNSAVIQSGLDAPIEPEAQTLRIQVAEADQLQSERKTQLSNELATVDRLQRLVEQLRTQSARLTRSIVAESLLLDFEFLACPRCGAPVDSSRDSENVCRLCLQQPSPLVTREDLIKEQQRIDAQITETLDLIGVHKRTALQLERSIRDADSERSRLSEELDLRTRSYVSDASSAIARNSERRARSQELVARLKDYLQLFSRLDSAQSQLHALQERRNDLQEGLIAQQTRDSQFATRVAALNEEFDSVVTQFNPPRFSGASEHSRIDPQTYLPVLFGRRFDELSSQGLKVIVNVAHAVAHQRAGIRLGLALPNILFIDGLTSNIGHREGLDRDRVEAIYGYLIGLSSELGEQLQVIVADHDVPDLARDFIISRFTEVDRLVPQ